MPSLLFVELVVYLPCPRYFGLEAFLFDVIVNLDEFTDESVELLLLLLEASLMGKDARLTLALVFFLLVGGFLVAHRSRSMTASPQNKPFPLPRCASKLGSLVVSGLESSSSRS